MLLRYPGLHLSQSVELKSSGWSGGGSTSLGSRAAGARSVLAVDRALLPGDGSLAPSSSSSVSVQKPEGPGRSRGSRMLPREAEVKRPRRTDRATSLSLDRQLTHESYPLAAGECNPSVDWVEGDLNERSPA